MSAGDLEDQLDEIRQKVSREEFVELLLNYLSQDRDEEERNILEISLTVHGCRDENMIHYWENVLTSNYDHPWRQERAASTLLAECLGNKGSALARTILREFFGKEPSRVALNEWRFHHLGLDKFFPDGI
jgi:hypothetical protein